MKKILTTLFALTLLMSTGICQIPVMTMETGKNRHEIFTTFSFTLRANADNTQIQVDFGDGILVNKTIGTSQTTITDTLVGLYTISIYGTGITHLGCNYHQIFSLDVTRNPDLTYLECADTQITTLDVTHNTALTHLNCGLTLLGSLDLTQNPALTNLYCDFTHFKTLDVSGNIALTHLICQNTPLTSLDVTRNTALQYLDCSHTQLTGLDLTNNTELQYLDCSYDQLTTLDVTKNLALQYLYCSNNQITGLNVTKNTALQYLYCSYNLLTGLDVTENTALTKLACDFNLITALDLTRNESLKYLNCAHNQLIALDITKNIALQFLWCRFNQLAVLDLTRNNALAVIDFSDNQFTFATMPIRTSTALYAPQKAISIDKDLLTGVELDLSSQYKVRVYTTVYTWKSKSGTALVEGIDYMIHNGKTIFLKAQADSVCCNMTNASFPDFSIYEGLKTTYTKVAGAVIPTMCMTTANTAGSVMSFALATNLDSTQIQVDFGNDILVNKTIDTSETTISGTIGDSQTVNVYGLGISNLSCPGNQLTALDVNQNPKLQYLDCSSNQLTVLDVSKDTALTALCCSNNQLTFSTLPLKRLTWSTYIYAPQKPIPIVKDLFTGAELDLSSLITVDNNTSVYTWKNQSGSTLVQGTDYAINNGITVFLKGQADSVYCEMINAAFPDFTGSNVLKTTNTMVTSSTDIEEMSSSLLEIYIHDKTLTINSPYNAQLSVFDLNGRALIRTNIYFGINKFQMRNTGVYLIKIVSNNDLVVRKVFFE